MSNKDKRIDELDIKRPRKIYIKDFLRLNDSRISSIERRENYTKELITHPGGGGALGYFLGGCVPPGTPNWHPVLKKNSPKIDTPF